MSTFSLALIKLSGKGNRHQSFAWDPFLERVFCAVAFSLHYVHTSVFGMDENLLQAAFWIS